MAGIILALILFSVIVIIHEFGHFFLAKKNGIEVFEFSLGMGPTIISKEIKGTKFSLKVFPIGGACMMGEDGEDEDEIKGNFNEKSVWARMSVILAGPIFNFILAYVVSVIMVAWSGYSPTIIGEVGENSPAQEAGLEAGDEIIKMGGERTLVWSEVAMYNQMHQGEEVEVTYERGGERYTTIVVPAYDEELEIYRLFITSIGNQKANIVDALEYGAYNVVYVIESVIDALGQLVTGGLSLDAVGGPVMIVTAVGDNYEAVSEYGFEAIVFDMMSWIVLLSANLGVMNLLPLPALDGGRFIFLLIEAVRGKRMPPEKEGMVHIIGFALLMVLTVVVLFNDISRLIG